MKKLLVIGACLLPTILLAQITEDPKQQNALENSVETIAETTEEEMDYNTLIEGLVEYSENPINLNRADAEALRELGLLDEVAVASLIDHINAHGKLMSLLELQSIQGFDLAMIRAIMPFVKVEGDDSRPRFTIREMFKEGKHEVFLRYQQVLEEQEGYSPIEDSLLAENPNRRYLGDPYRLYARYRFKYSNKISWGVTMEKDPGEEFFVGSKKQGFDFYSGHFFMKNFGALKALAVGDYQAQFGQGLTFWSGLAFGKSANAIGIKRNASGLRPYTSVDENRFLRGVGSTVRIKNFEITAFGSIKRIDASIADSDTALDAEDVVFTSFQQSGFHRTPNELEGEDAITEIIYGGHAAFKNHRLNVGITAVGYQFSGAVNRTDALYNQNRFEGKSNANFGVDYSYIWRNFNLFGETSIGMNGGMATINGLFMTVDPKLTLVGMHRYFAKDYQGLYANSIGENTAVENEHAGYIGFNAHPFKSWYVTTYLDVFRFPWLKFGVDRPSTGYDIISQVRFRPSRNLEVYARFKQEKKQKNVPSAFDDEPVTGLEDELRTYYRLNLTVSLTKTIKIRSRVEYARYRRADRPVEQGIMMYQDLIWKPKSFPVSFSGRLAYFDTDSYNARMYAYENDVLYAYSIPAYYYRGMRWYAMIRYRAFRNMDVWVRFAQSYFSDREIIGSGLEEIQGRQRTEVKVQVRLKF